LGVLNEILGSDLSGKGETKYVTDRERAAHDFQYFALTYFPHIFSKPLSQFHRDMFKDSERMILGDRYSQKFFVRAAPRGYGKSRIISVVLPLWCIVFRYRKNIVLIADTGPQSTEYIQTIKDELESNERLREDFGQLESDKKWSETEIETNNGVHVVSKSSGKSLRGMSWHNIRPDLVVLDDLENDEMVNTEDQRAKLRTWFTKVVLPIGTEYTSFLYVGSILHYESLLNIVLTNPKYSNWDRKIYRSIYEFSTSPLWNEWQELFTDLSDTRAAQTAYKFYQAHREEMLKGTEILWPEWRTDRDGNSDTYYNLMIQQLQDADAFNSEYQNNPMTEDTRIFKEAWIQNNYYDSLPTMKAIYGAVDLSMGKTRTADTSAIIIVGQGVDNYLYVLEADITRRSPDQIITDIIRYINKYENSLTGFVVETNVFQEFFANTLEKMCLDMGLYVNWIERKNVIGDNKLLRIKSMAPKVKLGFIKFNPYHKVLEAQLKDFPKSHDDGPDALEMCISQISASAAHIAATCVQTPGSYEAKLMNEEKLLKGWFKST
jgi:predicted phage terminase large subunit-like protein